MGEYIDVPELCKSIKVTDLKDVSLVPSKYIEFINRTDNVGYEEKMSILQSEIKQLLKEEEESRKAVIDVFKSLGYEL